MRLILSCLVTLAVLLPWPAQPQSASEDSWKPIADWGHWILGHRSNPEFLEKNHMTVTFGSGAPNPETVTRAQFDSMMTEARAFNDRYHDMGYIVLRYLSTSLNGDSDTPTTEPEKEEIDLLEFYNTRWNDFADYIGPKPAEPPTTWMMVHPDGSFPYYRYAPYGQTPDQGFEAWGVPANPHYVRYMEGKIRAQAETGIDGSYVDWTHIAGNTSYDPYTRKDFIAYLKDHLPADVAERKYGTSDYEGIELPTERGQPFWMEWITYRGWSVARFHARLRDVARQYNPHFMISGNVFGGFGYGPIAYDAAGNMEMLGEADDFIYSEIQEFLDTAPRKDSTGTKVTNSPALKFLAAASHGKPTIIYATEITPPIFPDPTEKCLSAMAQINIAEAVANHAIFREKRETPAGATAMYDFLARQRERFTGAHLTGNVAILASLKPYLADELSFAFSASRVLTDRGINHVMIVEKDLLEGDLSAYDLIYLPYMPLLSVEKQRALLDYVRGGGNLLVLGRTGHKDRSNLPLAQPPLAVVLGGSYPDAAKTVTIGKGVLHYQPVAIPDHRFLIDMKAKGEYTTFGPTMADMFADIPEGYTRNRMHPELRTLLEASADRIEAGLPGRLTRLRGEQPYVELSVMRHAEKNLLLVHLVNYDVTLDGTITPARELSVDVALPVGATVASARYSGNLGELKPVTMSGTTGLVTLNLPEVELYGLAVLELTMEEK